MQWLYDELAQCLHREEVCDLVYKLEQKAKEMERQQIEDAFKHGQNNGFMYRERGFDTISSNQFYKQIYGGQDE